MSQAHSFEIGALVESRGRRWVVVPPPHGDPIDADPRLVFLRPLGGVDQEVVAALATLSAEQIASVQFQKVSVDRDHGALPQLELLEQAARLSLRSAAGPFQSLARIAVEPRPYQLVPLLLAMRLDPVRLLIADDVGVGKTIEACLIARELWDRGEIQRFCVLCPPHLAEQWERALRHQFLFDPVCVLPATVAALERRAGKSALEAFPVTVVSLDFIKSQSRREEFLRTCPDLVIVDEAHGCAQLDADLMGRSQQQQRHQLLRDALAHKEREGQPLHMLLVTATPHTGKHAAFTSLLGLLNPELTALPERPEGLAGSSLDAAKRLLSAHMVQRKRAEVIASAGEGRHFPRKLTSQREYPFHTAYKRFFHDALSLCLELLQAGPDGVPALRWWSALGLIHAISSSPAAAQQALAGRAASLHAQLDADAQLDQAQRATLDTAEDDAEEILDHTVSLRVVDPDAARLDALAARAEKLCGDKDTKLQSLLDALHNQHAARQPVIFCRYIPTAAYVAEQLRRALPDATVALITGDDARVLTAPIEDAPRVTRQEVLDALDAAPRRILVCTDCLSEGIDLQYSFDMVVHYDMAWSPTRHEQREGRVDRFGQPRPDVLIMSLIGSDNPMDAFIANILQQKQRVIRSDLGVQIPAPQVQQVVTSIKDLLEGKSSGPDGQQLLFSMESLSEQSHKRLRTLLNHEAVLNDVQRTLQPRLVALRDKIGTSAQALDFLRRSAEALQIPHARPAPHVVRFDLSSPRHAELRDRVGRGALLIVDEEAEAAPSLPPHDAERIVRTHPYVAAIAGYIYELAHDDHVRFDGPSPVARISAARGEALDAPCLVACLRARYEVSFLGASERRTTLLLEDILELTAPLDDALRPTRDELGEVALTTTPAPRACAQLDEAARLTALFTLESSLSPIEARIAAYLNTTHKEQILRDYNSLRVRKNTKAFRHVRVRYVGPFDVITYLLLLR
jgi:superfamily II DNA or RNA helicase